ncbi:unnamed protein product [Linum trigynum]|uniref:Uncharacterized protein n=1 Tax=Linum trigynum TaxID=586398 RepID=A0AAV2DSB8_9ROSI
MTKKLGRQVYDEYDQSLVFGGSRSSVWVNRQPRLQDAGAGRQENNKAGRVHLNGQVGWQKEQQAPAGRESMEPHPDDMQVDAELVRSPMRRQSPKGFVMNRPPKVKFGGGGKQKMAASTKETASRVLGGKKGGWRPQNPVREGRGSPAPTAVVPAGGIPEQARRRRLILEADLDDDMGDLPQPEVQASPCDQQPRQEAHPSSYPVREAGGSSVGTVKPAKRRLCWKASKTATSVTDGAAVYVARPVDQKPRQVRVGHGKEGRVQGADSTVPLTTPHKDDGSAGVTAVEVVSGASEAGVMTTPSVRMRHFERRRARPCLATRRVRGWGPILIALKSENVTRVPPR